MKPIHWKDVTDLVGAAAIVASLIFVGLQLRQEKTLGLTDITSARTESAIALTQLVAEHRDLWMRGLDGEELAVDEEMIFFAIAEAIETYLFEEWSNLAQMGDGGFANDVLKDYAYQIYSYPGLRRLWQQDGERLRAQNSMNPGNPFRRAIDKEIAELEASGYVPSEKLNYVYW
jgi:hypothetical protein